MTEPNLTEIDVDMTVRSLMLATIEMDGYRQSNEARKFLQDNFADIELTRDRLSTIIDDVRGVYRG